MMLYFPGVMVKTNKIRQLLASAVILAGVALGITIAVKMYREKVPAPLSAGRFPAADASLEKIHYTETKQGKKCWDLVADTANYTKERDVTRLSGVRFVVAGNGETGDITVVADRANYHNTSGDV